MTTTATHTITTPEVRGELVVNEAAVGNELCIPTNQLVAGDTIIVSGLPSGNTRRVLEVRIIDGAAYINTVSGWFRYRKVYIHVVTPKPAAPAARQAATPEPVAFTYVNDCTYATDPATLVDVKAGDRINVVVPNGAFAGTFTAEVTKVGRDEFGMYFHGLEILWGQLTDRVVYAETILHQITAL